MMGLTKEQTIENAIASVEKAYMDTESEQIERGLRYARRHLVDALVDLRKVPCEPSDGSMTIDELDELQNYKPVPARETMMHTVDSSQKISSLQRETIERALKRIVELLDDEDAHPTDTIEQIEETFARMGVPVGGLRDSACDRSCDGVG